jgi:DNA polymerase/3'-5' exonuclease PolX
MLWKLELRDLPGLGKKLHDLNEGIYKGIPYKVNSILDIKPEDVDKLPRESALALRYLDGEPFTRHELEHFKTKYAKLFAPFEKFELVGSYRRGKETMGDGDVLVLNPRNRILVESADVKVINIGQHKARALFKLDGEHGNNNPHVSGHTRWIPVDVVFTDDEHYPAALMHYTGSKLFNIHMTMHCAKLGIKLNEYGLWKNGKRIPSKSEADMFAAVGMKHVLPTQREEFREEMLQDRYRRMIVKDRQRREEKKIINAKRNHTTR